MKNKRMSEFFMREDEIKRLEKFEGGIENRIKLLDIVMEEIRGNERWMKLCNGKVWIWFRVELWRDILLDKGLSDEGKLSVMRLCVLEKVKYNNMGDKTLKRYVEKVMGEVKKEEKRIKDGKKEGEGEVTEKEGKEGLGGVKVAA